MIDLTDKQMYMLCEMSEIHLEWFNLYSPELNMSYEVVLKLNHQKMSDIVSSLQDSLCDEDMIDFIFISIIKDYRDMLNDYSLESDESI